ncbi:hypothetical protein [Vibrio agarivorans]|uniref:hypothetical protein n=1 Tax=Vibrio agarivorans TaxID=153622 RepID=UPI0025B551BA|nr:hypothetical protein [Vibrio agarivorans]MDN3661135.1 hypothetical protein [Vibrio agarivorans]
MSIKSVIRTDLVSLCDHQPPLFALEPLVPLSDYVEANNLLFANDTNRLVENVPLSAIVGMNKSHVITWDDALRGGLTSMSRALAQMSKNPQHYLSGEVDHGCILIKIGVAYFIECNGNECIPIVKRFLAHFHQQDSSEVFLQNVQVIEHKVDSVFLSQMHSIYELCQARTDLFVDVTHRHDDALPCVSVYSSRSGKPTRLFKRSQLHELIHTLEHNPKHLLKPLWLSRVLARLQTLQRV